MKLKVASFHFEPWSIRHELYYKIHGVQPIRVYPTKKEKNNFNFLNLIEDIDDIIFNLLKTRLNYVSFLLQNEVNKSKAIENVLPLLKTRMTLSWATRGVHGTVLEHQWSNGRSLCVPHGTVTAIQNPLEYS